MNNLRAVLFDFDGTIADSEPLHFASFQEVLLDMCDYRIEEKEYIKDYLAYDDRNFFLNISKNHNLKFDEKQILRLMDAKKNHFDRKSEDIVFFEGILDFIKELSKSFPLAIASGALEPEIKPPLEKVGALSYFEVIVSAEMVSNGKPDPESFLLALSLINEKISGKKIRPEECLVFEDSIYGVEAANKSRMRSIAVTTSFSYEELSGVSDKVVDRISLESLGTSRVLKEWFLSL